MLIRVYELARDAGVSSSTVMEMARVLGHPVLSASRTLPPEIHRRLREELFPGAPLPEHPLPPKPTPPPSPSDRLTAVEASRALGVKPATIRKWVSRGYLVRTDTQGRAALYLRRNVEQAGRQAHNKTRRSAEPWATPRYRRPITALEASALVGVSPTTIRMWVNRGLLSPVARQGRRHLYDPMQILRTARR